MVGIIIWLGDYNIMLAYHELYASILKISTLDKCASKACKETHSALFLPAVNESDVGLKLPSRVLSSRSLFPSLSWNR